MKRIALLSFCLMLMIAVLFVTGCTEEASTQNQTVKVIVSRDFGEERLSDKVIDLKGDTSVMEIMEENWNVETEYGGGFINSIDSIKSGFTGAVDKRKIDWFYYVNGILSQVGAEDYFLRSNDVVIWDYHDWGSNMYLSSIIGSYPYNFINGYDGNPLKTEIRTDDDYKEACQELAAYLNNKGLQDVELKTLNEEGLEDENINSVIAGRWDEISKIGYIKDIYENGTRAGLFFNIGDSIKALDYRGKVSGSFQKGAVIASILKGYNSSSTIWLITGNDDRCIKKALEILYSYPEKIEGKFSVIVTENEIINLPTN